MPVRVRLEGCAVERVDVKTVSEVPQHRHGQADRRGGEIVSETCDYDDWELEPVGDGVTVWVIVFVKQEQPE